MCPKTPLKWDVFFRGLEPRFKTHGSLINSETKPAPHLIRKTQKLGLNGSPGDFCLFPALLVSLCFHCVFSLSAFYLGTNYLFQISTHSLIFASFLTYSKYFVGSVPLSHFLPLSNKRQKDNKNGSRFLLFTGVWSPEDNCSPLRAQYSCRISAISKMVIFINVVLSKSNLICYSTDTCVHAKFSFSRV